MTSVAVVEVVEDATGAAVEDATGAAVEAFGGAEAAGNSKKYIL